MRRLLVAPLLVVVLTFSACTSSEADGKVTAVGPREALTLIESGDYVVLDLRSAKAYEAGHVKGALSVPYGDGGLRERLVDLDADDQYLLYAKDPQVADRAADLLVSLGFTHVVDAGAFGFLALAGAELE